MKSCTIFAAGFICGIIILRILQTLSSGELGSVIAGELVDAVIALAVFFIMTILAMMVCGLIRGFIWLMKNIGKL